MPVSAITTSAAASFGPRRPSSASPCLRTPTQYRVCGVCAMVLIVPVSSFSLLPLPYHSAHFSSAGPPVYATSLSDVRPVYIPAFSAHQSVRMLRSGALALRCLESRTLGGPALLCCPSRTTPTIIAELPAPTLSRPTDYRSSVHSPAHRQKPHFCFQDLRHVFHGRPCGRCAAGASTLSILACLLTARNRFHSIL
ncbi:hypothetical protein B0H13DRAFT_2667267, partial [Mycena leptocephala]